MKKIEAMLSLQQELNDTTNGTNWENGITKNGKIIDWRRCIYLEAAELIESYPWKHWKNINANPDYDNIKIEAVDIWHFVMSEALRIYSINSLGGIKTLSIDICKQPNYSIFTNREVTLGNNYYDEIKQVEEFLKALFCDEPIEILIDKFFIIARRSGLNLDTLYRLYIGKNILNKFRQDNGYKDGSYVKIWNGREDNVVMQEILEVDSEISPEMLYNELEKAYQKI